VQLERLEEIERALIELDPSQFVRKVDVNHSNSNGGGGFSAPTTNPSLPAGSTTNSSEPSYSSY
jgi:hypothetical protein